MARALFLAVVVSASLLSPAATAQTPPAGGKGASVPLQQVQQPPPPPPAPPRPAPAAPKAPAPVTPKAGEVLLNFQAADIQAVVKAMSQMTKRNFLLDPRVKGSITIISAKPVSTSSAYLIFLSALKAQGFTAVEGVGHTRIVPTTEAKTGAEVYDEPRGGERIMTQVVIVQHSSATQIIPLLRPLMSPTSQLSAHEPGNALIITDYADNIRRLLRIIDKIDQPVSTDVTIIPLKHASALDLAELVTRLSLPGAGAPGQPVAAAPGGLGLPGDRFTIVPDLRTNSLLVRADNPGRVHQIHSLIEKLDVPATRGGQTRVVYLRNADAVKLADVLRGLLAGEARSQQVSATPTIPGGARAPAPAAKSAEASLIQADEATNALIISAPDAVYNNLRAVIEKLDVRRTQVYIEALLVEMSTDAARELGVQWAGGVPAGEGALAGIQNFPGARPGLIGAVADPTTLVGSAGLLLGYVGERVTLPDGTVIRSLGALARALESRNLANILSTPNLMTLDNAEAKIVVGQNVPFITGSFAQTAGATGTAAGVVNPFQTIERKDVGLMLKIKPQVSEGGLIKLDIFQEQSSIAPAATAGASDLVTNKRSLETKVVVDDGHTIVLGGLIEDTRNVSESRVPLLGDLPLIGSLFRYREATKKRTNLMVFLRPVIIYGPNDAYASTIDRYHYLRGFVRDKDRQDMMNRFVPAAPGTKPTRDKDPRRSDESAAAPAEAAKTEEPAAKPATPATSEPPAPAETETTTE
jgi:general secretion pathway protein D